MQPFFRPDPIEHARVPIYLGGIGPKMVALAGEVADGLMTHPTNTAPRYLREVIRPRVGDAELMVGPLIATGPDAASVEAERERTRQLLGFLYSTPAYWPSLELFGWGERGEKLHALTRGGNWDAMAQIVDDEMLATFAPTGTYDEIAKTLTDRYAPLCNWITFPMPSDPALDPEAAKVIARLRN